MTQELIVDAFAGGGGASLGIEMALGRSPDIAVNHDPEAVAMHAANHPTTRHLCGDVWDVRPREVCEGRPVGLLWASPDCTFHSKARGGKPFRDRKSASGRRGLAWVVTRWARDVKPRVICLENVEEFEDWGPLGEDGRPDPARRGLTFRRWVGTLRAAGYDVEWRELRACDYGAPTTRKRLFVVARCDGQPIVWPEPTHGPGRAAPHRTAAECIDWSLPCPSIFGRKKPLAENTLRRIARGIQRFVLDSGDPFIVPNTHGGDARVHSVHDPMRTVTCANRGELSLVATSFVRTDMHKSNAGCAYPAKEPLRTVTSSGGHGLVAATLIHSGNGEREGQAPRTYDIKKPLGTVMAEGVKHALVAPTLVKNMTNNVGQRVDGPLSTVLTGNHHYLAAGFLAKHFGGHEGPGSSLAAPMSTVTAQDHHALVTSHMLKLYGTCRDGQQVNVPFPTVRARGTHLAEVRAFLTRYNGQGEGQPLQLSLGAVTTRDRFGLVTVRGEPYEIADIGMRMLQPRELFRAQGFPDSYVIESVGELTLTKTAQVRMAGNSVCPPIAAAIVAANVGAEGRERAA